MTAPTTVDDAEVRQFAALADTWWDPDGPMAPLHRMNPVRLACLRDTICARFGRDPLAPRPLAGLDIVDVGCGAGLATEPLARLGANVLGLDASEEVVHAAAAHAREAGVDVAYRTATVEALAAEGARFDVVLALEVVEHVADLDLFLGAAAQVTRPGGLLFVATLNRTLRALALAKIGAEYVLRWLPRGTHDWRQFRKPSEVAAVMRQHGPTPCGATGIVYDPISGEFRQDPRDLAVNYMLWAERPA